MTRRRTPSTRQKRLGAPSRLLAMAFAFAVPATGAMAQGAQKLEVSGYVAPRCWTLPAATLLAPPTVRCNTADPQLAFRTRAEARDLSGQTLRASALPAWAQREGLSLPAPIEVIVSPSL